MKGKQILTTSVIPVKCRVLFKSTRLPSGVYFLTKFQDVTTYLQDLVWVSESLEILKLHMLSMKTVSPTKRIHCHQIAV